MKHGDHSILVDGWVARLGIEFGDLRVANLKDQTIFQQLLADNDDRTDGRRSRLNAATPFIPTPVWFVLILAGVITIGFVILFKDKAEPFPVQATLIAGVSVVVVAGLCMVWFLDHPYRDSTGSLQPTEMRQTLGTITEATPGSTPPCDPKGLPRVA